MIFAIILFAFFIVFVLPRFLFGRLHHLKIYFIIRGTKEIEMNLKANDTLPVSLQVADEFGNPTQGAFDAPPAWSLTDSSLGSVAVAADGMSGVVTPSGKLGSCSLQVLGAVNGQQVQGTLALVVIAGDVAEMTLIPGTPVSFVPAAPTPAP